MVTITCYGGVFEIGGNKILIENNDSRLFLDFGSRMGFEGNFFSDFLDTRTNTELKDKLTLGVLPRLSGLYRADLIKPANMDQIGKSEDFRILDENSQYLTLNDLQTFEEYKTEKGKPFLDGVLLSHAHLDHTGAIGFLHPSIPLFCSEVTEILVRAIDDVTTFKSNALTSKSNEIKLTGSGATFPNTPSISHSNKYERLCSVMKDLEIRKIGAFNVMHISQDHSVPGASSYIINPENSNIKILYTGDIRFHGTYPLTIDQYVEKVGQNVDVMLCEGTRIPSEKIINETDIRKEITTKVSSVNGLVFIDFSWKDTTRYETIKDAAEKAGRIFVINARLAYLLDKLNMYPDNDKVKVFLKRKGSVLYSPSDYSRSKYELGIFAAWDKDNESDKALIHYENGIVAEDIKREPNKYMMMLSYFDLGQIFDLADEFGKIPNSFFIKAVCAPFCDEMELDEGRFINWLDQFGIGYEIDETPLPDDCTNPNCDKLKQRILRSHVSGHASRPELKELINKIKPKKLIPIHTENPEEFEKIVNELNLETEVIFLKYGEQISL